MLANAAGPEPAQEYVELRNLGGDAVSLAGLRLEDAKGGDDLPAETLAPGGYALVVPSGYDPAQGQDPAPRAGTLLRAGRHAHRRRRARRTAASWSG